MKVYIIESRPVRDDDAEFSPIFGAEYTDPREAVREFERLDELNGHDTYHQVVEVRRRILHSR